ncbi:MAG TPA: hypothetical protein DDZ89_17835 [Clostridiales bacterium]|nr:hypothetical protein [Clostridiales bacterium]
MNIGLFCKGIDIMPDWGYPTVVYEGGFSANEYRWGKSIFVHNCATMDRSSGQRGVGSVDLWAPGENIKSITCQNPDMIDGGKQYARTLSLLDISEDDFYIIDIFRLSGNGQLYERYMHSAVGSLTTSGVQLKPFENEFDQRLFFENVKKDNHPKHGWSADFHVEDYFDFVDEKRDWHLKCTDLTFDSGAMIADMRFFGNRNYEQYLDHELLLPCVITQKQNNDPYQPAIFVQVIEPYEGKSNLCSIERITTGIPEEVVVMKISTQNSTDFLIYNDPYNQQPVEIPEHMIRTDAMVAFVRIQNSSPQYIYYSKGTYLSVDGYRFDNKNEKNMVEAMLS